MGVFSSSQLKEMAIGLERSGVRFLWAVRAPKEDGQTQARKTEQKMNSVFLVEEIKVGLAVKLEDEDDFVSAAELEERVTELMNSKKGEALRERVKAVREAAVVAKSEGGSAYVAMEGLVASFR
ncbi:hypothetical protein D5086_022992 [Populus alba]|uniref:Uncharacterized protein n=1 Tax=Populus alba TaxID=43335 RepID=A0ACC4B947_POPAL